MIKVKLSINSPKLGLLRQTPNNDGIWDNYKFYINDNVEECDFWVVYSKGEWKNNKSKVSNDNLILLTGEPESIYHYSQFFVKKFGTVLTSRKDLNHKKIIQTHPAQPWWVGRKISSKKETKFVADFNDLKKNIKKKSKLLSVITSLKGFTEGHKKRIKFVRELKKYFGESLDVFGFGINDFEDKWETLKDYKYHIVIENSSYDDYWTEKLSDCFLAECFPFYYGCKNINDYFDELSLKVIDINDFKGSIKTIESVISNDLYESRLEHIRKSKHLILYKYNIFPMLIEQFSKHDVNAKKQIVKIKHETQFFDLHKIWMIFKRLYISKFKK